MSPNVFFTADTHFYHRNMVEKKWRPFATVKEMNETLIDRWNSVVMPQDTVWHLGDVGIGPMPELLALVRNRLNGTKRLVAGNHDQPWVGNRDAPRHMRPWLASFQSIHHVVRKKINGLDVLLSHMPYQDGDLDPSFQQYRLPNLGLPLLCGHVHTEWKISGRQINVGVDQWEWRPVPLEEIHRLLQELPGPSVRPVSSATE